MTSTCDPGDCTKPACRRIMRRMGLSQREIAASLAWFEQQDSYCDCEVLFYSSFRGEVGGIRRLMQCQIR
jgi:hypothetical protein